ELALVGLDLRQRLVELGLGVRVLHERLHDADAEDEAEHDLAEHESREDQEEDDSLHAVAERGQETNQPDDVVEAPDERDHADPGLEGDDLVEGLLRIGALRHDHLRNREAPEDEQPDSVDDVHLDTPFSPACYSLPGARVSNFHRLIHSSEDTTGIWRAR